MSQAAYCGVVEREIAQSGGAGGADAVLGPGLPPVVQFEGGDCRVFDLERFASPDALTLRHSR
jgi:hypothetical protein